ncbi:MAG TPA: ATP-binding protein, partial [Nitrospirae bacterium]|nr:ATP-binding protein [Nitrospirota bacterium]
MFSVVSLTLLKFQLAPSVSAIGNIGGASVTEGSVSKLQIPWHELKKHPTCFQLLSWHTRVSKFSGRDEEMAKLQKWAESDDAISVQFVIGDGGVGKSRLAAEFGKSLIESEWSAGFVDLRNVSAFEMNKAGTLLIIDYPEEHGKPVEDLLADLAKLSHDKVDRLRVLFLTRQEMSVWDDVVSRAKAEDIIETVPVQIGPLEAVSAHKLYCSTLELAAKELDFNPPPLSEEALDAWMGQSPENKRALFIMAAAVHSVLHPKEELVTFSGAEIMNALSKRELDRLNNASKEIGASEAALARLLAMGAIAGRMHITRIEELVAQKDLKLGFSSKEDLEEMLQTTGILNDRAVHAPTPDILAAAFTVNVLSKRPETAPEVIWAALEQDVKGGLERLSRLAYDAEFVLGMLEHRMSHWLADVFRDNLERCKQVEGIMNEDYLPLTLNNAAVAVFETLLAHAKDDKTRALLLNNLSESLSDVGDLAGALKIIKEAVEITKKLYEDNPARYAPILAGSLNNLSLKLSSTGDKDGALSAIEEAVELYRKLNKGNTVRYAPILAGSLNNLSLKLSSTGDKDGALSAI